MNTKEYSQKIEYIWDYAFKKAHPYISNRCPLKNIDDLLPLVSNDLKKKLVEIKHHLKVLFSAGRLGKDAAYRVDFSYTNPNDFSYVVYTDNKNKAFSKAVSRLVYDLKRKNVKGISYALIHNALRENRISAKVTLL